MLAPSAFHLPWDCLLNHCRIEIPFIIYIVSFACSFSCYKLDTSSVTHDGDCNSLSLYLCLESVFSSSFMFYFHFESLCLGGVVAQMDVMGRGRSNHLFASVEYSICEVCGL